MSKPFNPISSRVLILDASLSWLAFIPFYGGYKPQRIRKGSTPSAMRLLYLYFIRTHAPKQCKRHKHEQRHFFFTRSASVCTRRSFSASGIRLTRTLKKRFPCLIFGARISDLLSKYGKASSIASQFGDVLSCRIRKNLKYSTSTIRIAQLALVCISQVSNQLIVTLNML